MKIELISSKKIKIGDSFYENDCVISSAGEIFDWKRESDRLTEKDLESLLGKDPDLIIVGEKENFKGVPQSSFKRLKEDDVILITDKLFEAVNSFNTVLKTKKSALIVLPLG